ncbi:hypothetical protein B0H19DRAFT_1164512 [Mycena capillaripes]|nr:hypothetical protein B0H19DRAFT_1164512 [Mycena capillaripes]
MTRVSKSPLLGWTFLALPTSAGPVGSSGSAAASLCLMSGNMKTTAGPCGPSRRTPCTARASLGISSGMAG